ncbi:hypothetical protein GH714_027229 [Hevea brasiliensis]|uniref:Uncharacterized protein n=1 Tax=Hevea brasiliensis TaxID=3981 RepID=A0A6A6LRM4_HEVBR|nr:hypothetical protein GH714_027229 [Hevea brasiliensis]
MLILPPLKKLEHLEVLSLAGMQTVCDGFVNEFVVACGHNMKELVFKDCVDEAIAAFVETSGELLKELSLNNVKKVGHSTALSLARSSRNLLSWDLSCRNMTDEAVGLIVDSCSSLGKLKLFGCGQITNVFLDGYSNPELETIGLKMSPVLEHTWVPDSPEFPLRYSSVHPSL